MKAKGTNWRIHFIHAYVYYVILTCYIFTCWMVLGKLWVGIYITVAKTKERKKVKAAGKFSSIGWRFADANKGPFPLELVENS